MRYSDSVLYDQQRTKYKKKNVPDILTDVVHYLFYSDGAKQQLTFNVKIVNWYFTLSQKSFNQVLLAIA